MAAVKAMTNCPSEETLAAFLDGHLDREARKGVIEHLAECGECREIVLAAGEVAAGVNDPKVVELRPITRYRWTAIGTVAAAAALALFLPPVQERIAYSRTGGLSEVQTAYGTLSHRPIESRLGGFAHLEFKSPKRSGNEPQDVDLEKALLYEASAKIEAEEVESSWRKLRALASVKLLIGKRVEAVELMERAVALEPDSPGLRSDLAAVYVERARWDGRTEYVVQALQAAERAWALAQTPETAWNRALALKIARRDELAMRAWEEYLKLDSESGWSDEARMNLQRLQSQ